MCGHAEQWGKPERNAAGDPICRWCHGLVQAATAARSAAMRACTNGKSAAVVVRASAGQETRQRGSVRSAGSTWPRRIANGRDRNLPPTIVPRDEPGGPHARAGRPITFSPWDGGGECGLENYRFLCRLVTSRSRSVGGAQRSSNSEKQAFDSPETPLAQGRPFDSPETPLAQGRPFDSPETRSLGQALRLAEIPLAQAGSLRFARYRLAQGRQ